MENRRKIQLGKNKIVILASRKKSIKARILSYLRSNRVLIYFFAFLTTVALFGAVTSLLNAQDEKEVVVVEKPVNIPVQPETDFEYPDILPDIANEAPFSYTKEIIEVDKPLKEFFLDRGFNSSTSISLAFQAKFIELFDFKTSHVFYTFKSTKEHTGNPTKFYIYEISMDSFAVILTLPKTDVQLQTIPLATKVKEIGGLVEHNFFWTSFLNQGGDYQLIPELLNALKWQIDFYHVKPNDQYKIVYEEKWYNDKRVGMGHLLAVYYRHLKKEYYAFRFENNGKAAYYDKQGGTMRSQFLMSPVEYNIINSPFNLNRVHPVLKIERPHLGTDYFASLNDPVFAVGNGRVMEARSSINNGNYVKIWHDEKYQTQYLHLNKIADDIRPGALVEQGQTIGYAGQTGLATGVHVCFRFWMNGEQVDHTKIETFQNTALPGQITDIAAFQQQRDSLLILLDKIDMN